MMRIRLPVVILILLFLVGCMLADGEKIVEGQVHKETALVDKVYEMTEEKDAQPFDFTRFNRTPHEWGERVEGVKTTMETPHKKMALTFDACGGPTGNGYDETLITFLIEENVPATLFVSEQWIHDNEQTFMKLAENPLFQIENHGTNHVPLSVDGGEAWGIRATSSPEEVYDEIMTNHDTVKQLTGKEMTLFRSGTAFYDEVAVELAEALGYTVVNFDILGDAGATYSSTEVTNALLAAEEGSIALLHMNQPSSGTAAGVKAAIPILRAQGFEFVLLEDEQLQ